MQNTRRYILLLVVAWLSIACRELPRYFMGEKPLARVGEKVLMPTDLAQSLPEGLSATDSAAYAHVYIDRWVRKQLKLMEAEQLFSSSVADIDRQVEEYRQSLLVRKLDQFCVDRMVDTTFTAEELEAYYNSHKGDFRLDRTIVKGCVVRVPKSYRQRARLKELMAAKSEARQQDFRDICLKQEFLLGDYATEWVDWIDFLSQLPVVRSANYDPLLQKSGVQEMSDRDAYYYFRIDEVRRAGEPAPLEQLRMTIRRILFNGRQQQVIRDHEEELYKNSLEAGLVRLYGGDEENGDNE